MNELVKKYCYLPTIKLAEAETPILWPPHAKSWLTGKDPDAGRDWGQEEEGTIEDEMAGSHLWHDGHEFEYRSWWWTGRPGVLWFMGSQRVGHDWATELNWTELKLYRICQVTVLLEALKWLLLVKQLHNSVNDGLQEGIFSPNFPPIVSGLEHDLSQFPTPRLTNLHVNHPERLCALFQWPSRETPSHVPSELLAYFPLRKHTFPACMKLDFIHTGWYVPRCMIFLSWSGA